MITTLRKMLAAATPGSWDAFGNGETWMVQATSPVSVATVSPSGTEADAALIAAMHLALPLLLTVADLAQLYLELPPSIPHEFHHERAKALAAALSALEGKS